MVVGADIEPADVITMMKTMLGFPCWACCAADRFTAEGIIKADSRTTTNENFLRRTFMFSPYLSEAEGNSANDSLECSVKNNAFVRII